MILEQEVGEHFSETGFTRNTSIRRKDQVKICWHSLHDGLLLCTLTVLCPWFRKWWFLHWMSQNVDLCQSASKTPWGLRGHFCNGLRLSGPSETPHSPQFLVGQLLPYHFVVAGLGEWCWLLQQCWFDKTCVYSIIHRKSFISLV